MRKSLRGSRAVAVGATAGVLATSAGAAYGDFTATRSAAQQVSTARLEPPTSLSAAPGTCTPAQSDEVAVSWVATSSQWADGYHVLRAPHADGPFVVVATVSGQAATTYVDPNLPFDMTFYYVVRAARNEWRSAVTTVVSWTTRAASCA